MTASRLSGLKVKDKVLLVAMATAGVALLSASAVFVASHVASLLGAAREVSERGDYSLRTAAGGADEVGQVAEAFNAMLGRVQERDAALEAARRDLERRVGERTADLAQRTASLEAANKELDAFAYSVSHDLRAPLRGIDGFAAALEADCGDRLDARGKEHLGRVRAAARRMGLLIEGLLRLSRLSRAELRPARVDLSALAAAVVERLRQAEPGRRVRVTIAPGLTVRGDAGLLEAALENLLGNAWKFTARKDEAAIEFGARPTEEGTAYFVSDDGAGFDMAYADKLFGAFQRLHTQEEFPGTGVGLATVARIIQRHGGRIWAESRLGQGSTFRFTLGVL